VFLGVAYRYQDSEIVSIDCKKGTSLTNEDIQSKELQIKIVDDDSYSIFSESIWDKFDKDTRIEVFLGVLINNFIYYVKTDECYFKKIEKGNNELCVTITGIGIISKYQDTKWYNLYTEIYLLPGTLQKILQDINGTDKKYEKFFKKIKIEDEIINEKQEIVRCFEKDTKVNEYLNELATNCRSNLLETYDNNVYYKRLKIDNSIATINLKNMEDYPEIEKEENKYSLMIKKYQHFITEEEQEVYKGKFTVKKYGDIWETYLNPYEDIELLETNIESYLNLSFKLNIYNADGTVYKSNITAVDNTFDIYTFPNVIVFFISDENLKNKIFELTLTCRTLSFTSVDNKIMNNNEEEEKNIDIRSLQDDDTIEKISNWFIDNLNKKFKFKIKINDTFTYELGDTVTIETGVYENEKMIIKKAIIVGIEYTYDGTLDYYLILKGA
jgi:hypothetical protein